MERTIERTEILLLQPSKQASRQRGPLYEWRLSYRVVPQHRRGS